MIHFEDKKIETKDLLAAQGEFQRTRYQTGWDKLNIKTYSEVNPLIQCWSAGFIEGLLSFKEISHYYHNIHIFFLNDEQSITKIKEFYRNVDKRIREKMELQNINNLSQQEFRKWTYTTCLHAQIEGLHAGYNTIADEKEKLDLLDFYFINSEGNFDDLKYFMQINNMNICDKTQFYTNENLQKVYNTTNIEQIWKRLIDNGHCSALVKLTKTKEPNSDKIIYDLIGGHNTWSAYCEMMRTLKYMEWAFEGDNISIGFVPRTISYSSYPGVLFSGDDFYLLDSKITILQTTLSALDKFAYKDLIDTEEYIPEFMRLMTTNFMSDSGEAWVHNYKNYTNHMYITQWLVLDYNQLDSLNQGNIPTNMVILLEEVPGHFKSLDITDKILKDSYFGSFNLVYFEEHKDVLGLTKFKGVEFTSERLNPRFYILRQFQNKINNYKDFEHVIQYNGFKKFNVNIPKDPSFNNPTNGISARGDLTANQELHGGIDFKVNI